MKAMIFAAGLGTRLYPITKDIPKALAPFGKTTLLGYNLDFLSKQGVSNFVINTHHFAEKIKLYLEENNNFGLNIKLIHETELLDTAGGLANAINLFEDAQDILLYNVDVISNIDINAFYKYHKNNNGSVTLAVRNRKTSRYLLFDDNNRLIGWQNKISGEVIWCSKQKLNANKLAFSGIHWINSSIFSALKPLKQSLIPFYLENGIDKKIMAFNHSNDLWFDCGKPESLHLAESNIKL